MIVSCFGVHWAPGDIPFLVQAHGTQNLISPDLPSPFITHIRPRRQRCPHQIDLENTTPSPEWLSDPLAQAMLPRPRTPGEPAKAIRDPDRKLEPLLMQLQRLSTPTEPLLKPIYWRHDVTETKGLYAVTNLTPLVWFGAEMPHWKIAANHALTGEVFNRRVLIVCRDWIGQHRGLEWIKTELSDVSSEPLEAIGAGVVRQYMDNGPAT